MKSFFTSALLVLAFLLTELLPCSGQLAYSPEVDSIVSQTDTTNLVLLVRQLSGDTSVVIGGQPHTLTSRFLYDPQNELATQFIAEQFEDYGYTPEIQNFNDSGANVIATKTGTLYPDQYFILCAHYDSYAFESPALAPGADDNASGTAAVLEAARLLFDVRTLYSIKFIAFDEEEAGCLGSLDFANQAAQSGMDIRGVINLDMLGYTSDDDFSHDLCRDYHNSPLSLDFASSVNFYYPELSTNYLRCAGSDHVYFWDNGYEAIGIIESHADFNPFYHSVQDVISNFNLEYYFLLVKSAYTTLIANAKGYKYSFVHEPLEHTTSTSPRLTEVRIIGVLPLAQGENAPRLYYTTDSTNYDFLLPYESIGDTFRYLLPGFSHGTIVNYYFAVQNENGHCSMTYPAGGYGLNPPGTVSPTETFNYIVDAIVYADRCSQTTPVPIPVNTTTYNEISVSDVGRIYDVNVMIDITHKVDRELEIYLIGPDSTTVTLADECGNTGDNYTQTTFDDEAVLIIYEGVPPFTGSFKPVMPLKSFRNKYTDGIWKLKINELNTYNPGGSLNSWCLHFIYIDTTVNITDLMPEYLTFNCYPNPVKDNLEMKVAVSCPFDVSIGIYNQTGMLVKRIINANLQSGTNIVVTSISDIPAGIYFVKLFSEKFITTRKIVVIR